MPANVLIQNRIDETVKEVRTPNAESKGASFKSVSDLMADLDADD